MSENEGGRESMRKRMSGEGERLREREIEKGKQRGVEVRDGGSRMHCGMAVINYLLCRCSSQSLFGGTIVSPVVKDSRHLDSHPRVAPRHHRGK